MDRTAAAPCRDCGTPLPPSIVGCARCGRNLRAERRIGRALGRAAVVLAVTALAVVAVRLWLG